MGRRRRKSGGNVQSGAVGGTVGGTNSGSSAGASDESEMRPRIAPPVAGRVRAFAESNGVPVQAVINLAIVEYLEKFR